MGDDRGGRRTWLVSFALPGTQEAQRRLRESALRLGITDGIEASLDHVSDHPAVRSRPQFTARLRDPGLALWRPIVILDALRGLADGDVLLYHDVGVGYWGEFDLRCDVGPILDWAVACNGGMLPGVWVPENGRNARWTSGRCFASMGCDAPAFRDMPQVQATYSVWQRNPRALAFLQRWQDACLTVYDREPAPGDPADAFDFVADRGSQSVLTNLVIEQRVACFGAPHETTAVVAHPHYAPIPASEIEALAARLAQERSHETEPVAAGTASDAPGRPPRRRALFTSIPPRISRHSATGFEIGETYQQACLASWRSQGFEIYSVHFEDDLADQPRLDGVTYVGVARTADDPPDEPKPSLEAILKTAVAVGADISGLINADILLLDPPGWRDAVDREIENSVIAFTRYETRDIDRVCVGTAPWGLDLFLFDTAIIDRLAYCGMRIGESWWDYWFPLAGHLAGATLKYVDDCVVLHLEHPIRSSKHVVPYGRRVLAFLEREGAAGARGRAVHAACRHRFTVLSEQLQIAETASPAFICGVVNPALWTWIVAQLAQGRVDLFPEENAHHRRLAALLLATLLHANQSASAPLTPWQKWVDDQRGRYTRMAQTYAARRGLPADAVDLALIAFARALRASPLLRLRIRFWDAVRRLWGKSPKALPSIASADEALALIAALERRVLGRLTLRLVALYG